MAPFGLSNGLHFFGAPGSLPDHIRDVFLLDKNTKNEVDERRLDAAQPGTIPVPSAQRPDFWSNLRGFCTLSVIWDTENLLWAVMAVALYLFFPFPDFADPINRSSGGVYSAPLTWEFFELRFPVWFWTQIVYVGIFHFGVVMWTKRPFAQPKQRNNSKKSFFNHKMTHNLFYSIIGVVIWVALENVVCYLWAQGKLAHTGPVVLHPAGENKKPVVVVRNLLVAVFGFSFALFVKDWCFFYTHRLLHFKAIYVFTHALHHRNAHPDAFGGLCMHPVELLFYYAAVLVSLLLPVLVFAPFLEWVLPVLLFPDDLATARFIVETLAPPLHPSVLVWIGVHQQISPAGAHTSVEDHWQQDLYHYLHHRFFNCAFATTGTSFLDEWFGSCPSEVYFSNDGQSKKHDDDDDDKSIYRVGGDYKKILAVEPEDAKATLVPDWRTLTLQSRDGLFSIYFAALCLCWAPWLTIATTPTAVDRLATLLVWMEKLRQLTGNVSITIEQVTLGIVSLAALSPMVLALVLYGRGVFSDALQPFIHKRPFWETLHVIVVGLSMSVLPVFVVLQKALE